MTSFPGLPAPLSPTGIQAPSPWSPFHRWQDRGLTPSRTSWATQEQGCPNEWETQQVLRSHWGGLTSQCPNKETEARLVEGLAQL